MRVDLLQYSLAPESIAQVPSADPLAARLLDIPATGPTVDRHVRDLPDHIPAGAIVVVNDTRVLPARLLGQKVGTGGKAEVFLVRRAQGSSNEQAGGVERWWALGKSSKGLRPGMTVMSGDLLIRVVERQAELYLVELALTGEAITKGVASVALGVERSGHVPLPPYIRRTDDALDRQRYQTMFARVPGAVAAPTAGLHLTPELVLRLEERGCRIAHVTLHVGLGTFQPVTVADFDDHPMHEEVYEVPLATAETIARGRKDGREVVAIGTTVVRALESARDPACAGLVLPGAGETRLLIQPGYRFSVVDRLFTNFHLPGSTLLALVAAFGGTDRVLAAYNDAQRRGFRFFSYGDAMLLEPRPEARGRRRTHETP
jgi:S-adenosylmethionine:tRNA ribosyltransferase-isomerase